VDHHKLIRAAEVEALEHPLLEAVQTVEQLVDLEAEEAVALEITEQAVLIMELVEVLEEHHHLGLVDLASKV
jgi:hypothetical protein